MNPLPATPVAENQASLWAARLEGSVLSPGDRAMLDAWLAADPAHRLLLSSYCQFSADLEQQLPLLAGIRDGLTDSPTAPNTLRPLSWLSRPIWGGAIVAAVAGVAVLLWQGRPQNFFLNLSAPVGGRHTAALPDGSQVELNAQTTVAVTYSPTERRVRLPAGEAFFQVSPDPARPFFVETPAGLIRVTGTAFNVRTDAASRLEVTVGHGTVQVRPGGTGGLCSLQAGDRLTATGGQLQLHRLSDPELADALAWRSGQAVFHDTPLVEALGLFARYHGRHLSAAPAAARQSVGGRYSLDDLDGFLNSLELFLPVRVNRELDGSILVEGRPRA